VDRVEDREYGRRAIVADAVNEIARTPRSWSAMASSAMDTPRKMEAATALRATNTCSGMGSFLR
jgi:hypothetical protein